MAEQMNPLRLRKKHGDGVALNTTAADGERLARSQSVRGAIVASLIAIVVFSLFWVLLTELLNRVLPWMTLVLGFLTGRFVQHAGKGIDWRFPLIAALMTIAGSVIANVAVAASVTADQYGTGTMQVLQAVTGMTWPVFFDEVWNMADALFAVSAAAVAAFFAPRHLTRPEYYALRLWREERARE